MLPYNYKLKKLKGDASFRTFYRQIKETKKSVIVHASKEKEKNLLIYDAINKILIKNKVIPDMEIVIINSKACGSKSKQAIEDDFEKLIKEMNEGKISALIVNNVNPIYNSALAEEFKSGLEKVDLTISFSPKRCMRSSIWSGVTTSEGRTSLTSS